jgi:hypothetical protein
MDKVKVNISSFMLSVIKQVCYFAITEREQELSKARTSSLAYRAGIRSIVLHTKDLIKRINQKTAIQKKQYNFNFSAADCVLLIELEIYLEYLYKKDTQCLLEYNSIKTEFDKHF